MRTRTWCVAAALAIVPRLVAAQTVLSEADALARLSAESPRVRAIRAAVAVARAEALSAGRWPNPRVTIDRESVAGVTEYLNFVTQPLPISGRRGLDVHAASALADATERRAAEEIRTVRASLRNAYADLVSAQQRETELAASSERLRGLAEVLARREAAGDAAGYDRLRAEREVAEIEADRAVVRADRVRAQAAVAAYFAPPTDALNVVAVVPQSVESQLPSVDTLVAHSITNLPELAALKKDLEAAEFAARAATRRLIPEPEISAGTKSSTLAGGDIGSVVTVLFSVPLFDRAKPEHALAEARRAQAEAQIAALDSSLRVRIAALRAMVVDRRQTASAYRASVATSTTELERIAAVSYDAGERGILELLDTYRNSAAARIRQAQLDLVARQAEIELELVSGWEIR